MKNYKNKKSIVKKLGYAGLIIAISATVLQGCANLDPDPVEFNLPPESFASLTDFDKGITGIYSTLLSAAQWTTFYAASWAGDDITTHFASNKADFRQFDQRVVQSTNGRLLNNWNAIYNIVNTANSLLERSQGMENLDVDQDRLNILIGEVYFLRGMALLHATRVHGKIPIPLTAIPDPNIGLSEQADVYLQIESDFMEAELRLPDIYPGQEAGAPRPNKGSAKSLLARLYLDWAGFPVKDASKYTSAATKAKEVIDNAALYQFELSDNLEDLWKVANRFNNESVFTISYCGSCGFNTANLKDGILGLPSDFGGWQETFAEIKYFEDFPEGARKEATYRTDLDYTTFSDQKSPIFKKIAGPVNDLPAAAFITDRNDFYMRYAEVLLIYAEASGRSGASSSDAWEALNMIRRRAEGLPYATADASIDVTSGDLAELAFTERKWEFAGEYLRWFDLVRMEKVEEALIARDSPGTIQEHNEIQGSLGTNNYFSPVPQAIIDLNPNLGN